MAQIGEKSESLKVKKKLAPQEQQAQEPIEGDVHVVNLSDTPAPVGEEIDNETTVVNLNKKEGPEGGTPTVEAPTEEEATPGEAQEQAPSEENDEPVIELVDDKEEAKPEEVTAVDDEIEEKEPTEEKNTQNIPEGLEDLAKFITETGGSVEDYVRLNADYSKVDDNALLREYYKHTKSNLDSEDINFLIEDRFSYDEEVDDERDIKRKKLAFKEEVLNARNFLNGLKDKYYKEIKSGSNLQPEQKKAFEFYQQYQKEQSEQAALRDKQVGVFTKKTNELFSDGFKGFEFKVGDKRYRFNVKDVESVKKTQSDLFESFKTFLNGENTLEDAAGYHKALFTARNADKIAAHFYEQGKADTIKEIAAKSKNISMNPRTSGFIETSGIKVRAVSGDDSSRLVIKAKKII